MTQRAAAYLRVSSEIQRTKGNIDNQRRDVPAYIHAMGWQHVATYEDDGRSAKEGKLEKRIGYARLLADARQRKFDLVVVASLDRLTRSKDPMERAAVTGMLHRAGVKIAVVGAGIQDQGTMAGDIYIAVMGVIAAAESEIKSARTIAGQITAAERGWNPRGCVPYGLAYSRERHLWSTHPVKGAAIRELFERVADREIPERIADDFNRRGIPTTARQGEWTGSRIRKLVQSDTYLGRHLTDAARGLHVRVPLLVDEDTVTMARAAIEERNQHPLGPHAKHPNLLAGFARCGLCRAPIGIGDFTQRPAIIHGKGYRCRNRRRPPFGQEKCALPIYHVTDVDERLWSGVRAKLASPTIVDYLIAARAAGPVVAVDPQPHRDELDRLKKLQDALTRMATTGDIDPDVAEARLTEIAARRRGAQDALSAALATQRGLRGASDLAAIEQTVAHLRHAMEKADADDRRSILPLALGSAVIGDSVIHAELTCDASAGQRQPSVNLEGRVVRRGIPLEIPIVPARPQTYRPARRKAA